MKLLLFPKQIEAYKISKEILELNEQIEAVENERLDAIISENLYQKISAQDQLRVLIEKRDKKLNELKNV